MKKAVNLLTALFLSLFVICASVSIVLYSKSIFYFDINFLNIPETSRMSENEIKENYNAVISYMNVFEKGELKLPTLPMSETGKIHFEDVKNIFSAFWYIGLISLILSCGLIIYCISDRNFRFLKTSGLILITTSVFAVLFVLFLGEQAFTLFHEIFFNNNYWIFDEATDPIIKILPEAFFLHSGTAIILFIFLCGIIMLFTHNYLT